MDMKAIGKFIDKNLETRIIPFLKAYYLSGLAFVAWIIIMTLVAALFSVKGKSSETSAYLFMLFGVVIVGYFGFIKNKRFAKYMTFVSPLVLIFFINMSSSRASKVDSVMSIAFPLLAPIGLYIYLKIQTAKAQVYAGANSNKRVTRGTEVFEDMLNTEDEIRKSLSDSKICFAGVTIKPSSESRHFVAIGTTGSGKSTAINEVLFTSKARGDRHIISDPDFSYSKKFMQSDDLLLNPFDENTAQWDYLSEIQHPSDYAFLASMIIPVSSKDDEWRAFARQLLASVTEGFKTRGLGSSSDFFNMITTAKTYELATLCEGTSSARFFEPDNEKMLGSILGTLVPFVEPLKYLGTLRGKEFSIRNWVKNGKGSLFLPYRANQIASLRSLISTWFALAVNETLSLEPSDSRKLWVVVDELDALGRIEGLKDALVRIRKFGGRAVLGFQSISQLIAVYGEHDANTIIENCGNKLILRCDGGNNNGTAEYASRMIGDREIEITSKSISRSTSHSRDGSNSSSASWSTSERVERAILASEISKLEDMQGYMKAANHDSWFKIGYQHVDFSIFKQ